jgi:hypothetical protein
VRKAALTENNDKKPNSPDDERAKEPGKGVTRPGLPAEASILSERVFVSPGKKRYRIITTSERDAYDSSNPVDEDKRR